MMKRISGVQQTVFRSLKLELLLIIAALPVFVSGQSSLIDSLKSELQQNKKDTLKIKDYAALWRNYMSLDLDSAYHYAITGLEVSEKIQAPNGIADFTVYAAFVKSQNGEKDEALSMMTEKLKLLEEEYDYLQGELFLIQWIAETYREHNQTDSALFYFEKMYANTKGVRPEFEVGANVGMAQVYQQERYYRLALQYYQVADSLCQVNNINTNTCTTCITNTGVILTEIYDFDNAYKYFQRAKTEYAARNEDFLLNELKFLLASVLAELGEEEKALDLTEKAIQFFASQNSQLKLYEGYETLISIKEKINKDHEIKYAAQQLYKIAHDLNDSIRIAKSYIRLANAEINLGDHSKSLKLLLTIQPFIDRTGDIHLKQAFSKILTGTYKNLENWKEAYYSGMQHYNYTRQIAQDLDFRGLKEVEIAYDIKNKEQRIELLNTEYELAQQRDINRTNMMIIGFSLLGLLIIALAYYSRLKQKTNTRLKELDKLKSRFFANISHELRTPITLIKNPLQLVIDEAKIDKRNNSRIQNALRNSSRLQHLVEDLLQLTKVQSGNLKLHLNEFDSTKHLESLITGFDPIKLNKDQEYKFKIEIKSFPLVYDPVIIETICSNLVSNAFKYSPVGAIIDVLLEMSEGQLIVKVSNTGPGINKNDETKIFDRFFQSENGRQQQSSLGIGLSLVKELVNKHYGTILFHSTPEVGTCFTVTLPVEIQFYIQKNCKIYPESKSTLLVHEVQDLEYDHYFFSEEEHAILPVLLIVEDNDDMRAHLKDLFEKDYRILEARNGKEGLQFALSQIPDLIISDMMMPEMSGDEMCDQIKQDPRISHIPIIILTAKAEESSKLATLEIGVNDYLSKPFSNQELVLKAANLLRQRERFRNIFDSKSDPKPEEVSTNTSDIKFWTALEEVLNKNFDESGFSINDFSREMHMSRMQLHRKLKALSNMSASVYLRNYRLKKAVSLIQNTDLTISEIAYDVGFSSPFYFSKCFKDLYGVAPSDYLTIPDIQ